MGDDVSYAHDRIANQLPRAVVGDAPAAVGGRDLDAALSVEVFAEGQLVGAGAPTARVDGGML